MGRSPLQELTSEPQMPTMTHKPSYGKPLLALFFLATTEAFQIRSLLPRPETCLFSDSPEQPQSIGDVVQGLHGSKYQFNDAGVSFEGQQFAEMGYSSGEVVEENYEDEPIPTWALKLKALTPHENASELSIIGSAEGAAALPVPVVVDIKNDERSWEKFHAFIVGDAGSLVVEPRVGMLAPRGGANNYSDTAQLRVTGAGNSGNVWLVVGTEAEKWTYKLICV
jgi:hypothetical protein